MTLTLTRRTTVKNNTTPSVPRIVIVASRIADIQVRRQTISKETDTLEDRIDKLASETSALKDEQLALQRELDNLGR